jgi:predicted PurR-regulated permease PerM
MTSIGLLSYFGYLVLGLSYAIPLALIAGLLEIVPNIGPIIATTLAALVGLTISPLTALFAIIWGIVIQQAENNIIVPKVMKATVGLNPIITILTIATGAQLGGVGGALLAVPIYLTLETIISTLYNNKK